MPRHYTPREPLTCEVCGKTVMLPPSIIAQGRRCCSAKCMGVLRRRRVDVTCSGCGNVFEEKASVAANGRKYCTESCRREHEKTRIVCEVCGKERRVTPSELALGARFCSLECARTVVNLPVERTIVVCEQCGKECHVLPSRAKRGMRFCSQSCRSLWTITHGKCQSPTTIEVAMYEALAALGVAYIPQHTITGAGTVADAYLPERNIVMYADGDYWHTLPKTAARDRRQEKKLAAMGYTVRRISEKELRSDPTAAVLAALA
jgi:G:T-mismatch repair DNA endonuclease (very short patch repair protein)